ncbi:TPA: acyl carrier protein, partial [Streptococcus pneumoniae]|nr:acyl carrier protein [Streptococcus pneumoniae]
DLDFDSLTITQLVIDIEEQFDIMLPPQKISMSEMETFGKIVDLVHKCITSKESR